MPRFNVIPGRSILRKTGRAAACGLLLAAAVPTLAFARRESPVFTKHQIRIRGHVWNYTAQVGRLPIRPMDSNEPHAYMFYVAYRVASAGATPRPILFLWGGGPSEPALGLQPTFGPKRVVDGKIVDNPLTLLTVADLVFVDPVGTGFSRPERAKYGAEFYNVLGDQASLAEFVREWRALYAAPNAPLFLYGVSYGTWRVSGVSELLEKEGIRVAGAILQSGGIQFGANAVPLAIRTALRVPGYAAAALYHGKLHASIGTRRGEVVAKATQWALKVYAPALSHIATLTDAERESIATQLSRFTGYPDHLINRKTLSFTPRQYLHGLLPGKTLDTFDMRVITGPGGSLAANAQGGLPQMVRYLRDELDYRTGLVYLGVGLKQGYMPIPGPKYRAPGQRWNYNSAKITPEAMAAAEAGEGPPGTQPWLRRAMAIDPDLKVLVGAGLYDSLNSCSAERELLRRIPPAEAANFTLECYSGGHDFQRDPAVEPHFIANMKSFIEKTISTRGRRAR